MTEELLNALKVIKAECEKQDSCKDCSLLNGHEHCGVRASYPEYWELEKREVYF